MRSRRACVALVLGLVAGGCSAVPMPSIALFPGPGPVQVVGRALQAVIDHDLVAASGYVCQERRDPAALPFPITGLFLPLAALGEVPQDAALSLVGIEPALMSAEATGDPGWQTVHVTGLLELQFDVPGVRELATRLTEGRDPALVDRVMRVTGDGHVSLSLDTRVQVLERDGTWLICEEPLES